LYNQRECTVSFEALSDLPELIFLDFALILIILLEHILLTLGLLSEMLLNNISCVSKDNEQNEVDKSKPCLNNRYLIWTHELKIKKNEPRQIAKSLEGDSAFSLVVQIAQGI
jgi:hypothetical protein